MDKYQKACLEIDKTHWQDINFELVNNIYYPSELLYTSRMIEVLSKFQPESSELIKLAVRCQHFKRWEIPRDKYPKDKIGYLRWRKELYVYQSEKASEVLKNNGYNDEFIADFKKLVQKKELKNNPNAQLVEDVACLTFLNYYLEDFSTKHVEDKLISIINKTWNKMSENAKATALKLT